uniref:Uncharacterized protein n=1 Tax=Octopus bimaculoides TaxID=37653 RepID=A0A0L8IHT8_OCTBM
MPELLEYYIYIFYFRSLAMQIAILFILMLLKCFIIEEFFFFLLYLYTYITVFPHSTDYHSPIMRLLILYPVV